MEMENEKETQKGEEVTEESGLGELIAQLPPNVATIICEYCGSGDDGGIDNVSFRKANNNFMDIDEELEDQFREFFDEYICGQHGGCFNNDGASGNITVSVAGRTLRNEHREYYTESNLSEYEEIF